MAKNEITIAILESLLDNSELTHEQKNHTRNVLVPMLEFIEDKKTPKDRYEALLVLLKMFSFITGFTLDSSIEPHAHNREALELSERLYKEIQLTLSLFYLMKAKPQTNKTVKTT